MNVNETLVVIPARGGSKEIPGKNTKLLGGKPLVNYTIEVALMVFPRENICLSSDSDEIIQIGEKAGLFVSFKRPPELATDKSGMQEVIIHAYNHYLRKGCKYKNIMLLQPTSPFRKPEHLTEALRLYNKDIDMVVSVHKSRANPYFNLFEEQPNGFLIKSKSGKFLRRQDCPSVWQLNGSIYVINPYYLQKKSFNEFSKMVKYEMSEKFSIDIDQPFDWELAMFMNKWEENES